MTKFRQSAIVKMAVNLAGLFPLTLQGTITLVVAASALNFFGYGSMDLVVFALAICGLAILIFCLFNTVIVGLLSQRKIRRLLSDTKLGTSSVEVEAGFPNETGFTLPAIKFFPLIRMQWRVVYPDSIETRVKVLDDSSMREEIVPQRRCLTDNVIREFSVSDVLGFCRFTWLQAQAVQLQSLPQTNSVKQLPILRSLTAEDGIPNPTGQPEGDRMEIRPYAPGDSVKNIMWKVFARNRQLNVRLPENSVFHSNRTVAYLLSSNSDEAAAAVARIAVESGALGDDWSFGADGTSSVCATVPECLQAIARSRALESPHSYGLDRFLEQSRATSGVHCVVFAAAEMTPSLPELKNTIARFGGQFSLVLATDGMEKKKATSMWEKLIFRTDTHQQPGSQREGSYNRVQDLLTDIGHLVESTLIIDRKTGLSFDRHLRKV